MKGWKEGKGGIDRESMEGVKGGGHIIIIILLSIYIVDCIMYL